MKERSLYYLYAETDRLGDDISGVFRKNASTEKQVYLPVNLSDKQLEIKSIRIRGATKGEVLLEDSIQVINICVKREIIEPNIIYVFGQSDNKVRIEGSNRDAVHFHQNQHLSEQNKNHIRLNSTEIQYTYDSDEIWRFDVISTGNATHVKQHSTSSELSENLSCTWGHELQYTTSEVVAVQYQDNIEYNIVGN